MTHARDMTIDELRKEAAKSSRVDDDWGNDLIREAQVELHKREEAKAAIDFPHGKPIPPLKERLQKLLGQRSSLGLPIQVTDILVEAIVEEVNKKEFPPPPQINPEAFDTYQNDVMST